MTPGNGNRGLLAIVGAFAALGLLFICAQADDGVMFGYTFEEGASQDYKVKFTQEMDYGGFASSQFMDFEDVGRPPAEGTPGMTTLAALFQRLKAQPQDGDERILAAVMSYEHSQREE